MRNGRLFVGILVCLPLGGCASEAADCARLSDELARVRSDLASHRADHRKTEGRLRRRVARLEADLAQVKRRAPPRPRVRTGDPVPGDHVVRAACIWLSFGRSWPA